MPYLIQGVDGPNGDDCVPEGWKFDRYYSPGQCPSGYKACTLPTVTQRVVTTEICCPSGFDCMFQDYCAKTFNSPSTITYSDSTISIKTTVWAATASAIQIRFQARDSSVVPVPTESFKLPMPKKEFSAGEKAGIGIGSAVGVALLGLGGFFGWRFWKKRRLSKVLERGPVRDSSVPDEPPPAYSRTSVKK
ncbi:unnamed protein product [Penicillium pancosmium]